MSDYDAVTIARYMRVMVRTCIDLHDIGFCDDAIDKILEVASEEIMRIISGEGCPQRAFRGGE